MAEKMFYAALARLIKFVRDAGVLRELRGKSKDTALDCLKIGFWAGLAVALAAERSEVEQRDGA